MKNTNMSIPTLETKRPLREKIAKDIAEYLAKGGKIYKAKLGECKEKPASEFIAKAYEGAKFG